MAFAPKRFFLPKPPRPVDLVQLAHAIMAMRHEENLKKEQKNRAWNEAQKAAFRMVVIPVAKTRQLITLAEGYLR